jgi:glutamate synthase domain-containing protein 2
MAATGSVGAMPVVAGVVVGLYWFQGMKDMRQERHAVLRNFPVLGNVRYIFEVIRPEIRQYFIESDSDGAPFSREQRSKVYQRAKAMPDALPFGTRKDTYGVGYEYICHSLFPKDCHYKASYSDETWVETNEEHTGTRVLVGKNNAEHGTTQPYSCSIFNISAMSFGALSSNAVLALNAGAKRGGFFHNTGEGGVSRYHKAPGGDIGECPPVIIILRHSSFSIADSVLQIHFAFYRFRWVLRNRLQSMRQRLLRLLSRQHWFGRPTLTRRVV